MTIEIERCAAGRLRNAYPVSANDVEIRVATEPIPTGLLGVLAAALEVAEPHCRRIIFAASPADSAAMAAAESAGFRHVADIDLPDAELSLMVAEPRWVTAIDANLDHVPGT